ncbi:MAG TPA: hypothetical protein VF064_08035, partial [Pyrinomonadaceae bacterium]
DDGDERLDRAVRLLTAGGATLVACETERGTLLDALESYEREDQREGNGDGDDEDNAGGGQGVRS